MIGRGEAESVRNGGRLEFELELQPATDPQQAKESDRLEFQFKYKLTSVAHRPSPCLIITAWIHSWDSPPSGELWPELYEF